MTPYLTDSDWLDLHQINIDEYVFSELVAIKLKAFTRPTQMQINAARLAAYEDLCTTES